MKEFLRKKYSFPITFLNKKTVYIKYEQGTLRELLELGENIKDEKTLTAWLYGFLCENSVDNVKISLKMFNQLKAKNLNDINSFILKTYAKGFFKEVTNSEKELPTQSAPDSSLFALIFQHSNETISSLLELTWEQIDYIIDGITWNLRGQTKEGQAENRRQWAMRQSKNELSDDVAIQQVRELEKRIKSKRSKNAK